MNQDDKITPVIIYIDMDDVLCDYTGAKNAALENNPEIEFPQSQSGFYSGLEPLIGAVDSVKKLIASEKYTTYILSAPSPLNPLSYTEKRIWIEKYFGIEFVDRLILSMNKGLLKGDILIDDFIEGRGQENFEGCLIQFGSKHFPDWKTINAFLHDEELSPELTAEEQELLGIANQRLQEAIEHTQSTHEHLSETLYNLSGNIKNRELGKLAQSINKLFGTSALSLDSDDFSALFNEIADPQQAIQKLQIFLNTPS